MGAQALLLTQAHTAGIYLHFLMQCRPDGFNFTLNGSIVRSVLIIHCVPAHLHRSQCFSNFLQSVRRKANCAYPLITHTFNFILIAGLLISTLHATIARKFVYMYVAITRWQPSRGDVTYCSVTSCIL